MYYKMLKLLVRIQLKIFKFGILVCIMSHFKQLKFKIFHTLSIFNLL